MFGVLFGTSILALGQTAPLGKDLVKSFSEKMKAYETIQATFSFTLENLQEGFSDTHKGKLRFNGNKYFLELMGMEVYYDGTTKWQFIPDANEVTVSAPTSLNGGFLDDPTQIFRDYEQDFKSRFIGETIEKGVAHYEVDLYPKDLSEPYSLIKIVFKKQNLDPVSIKYQSKDGINYIIKVSKFKPNVPVKDEDFVFEPNKHKGIEIVDLR
jgi:outer membrane lipoprotein-sorting protein